jgi:putative protein-disulfide isomerase
MTLYYCFDAYCGWCYGFSSVIKKISIEYKQQLHTEVLSGGMILPETPVHVSTMAGVVKNGYKRVEELADVKFGHDYLWHFMNADDSDWYPNSEKPAIALCILKEHFPDLQAQLAAEIQNALFKDGRDLTDREAYRHILEKYNLNVADFFQKLESENYKEKAYYEFALCKQLQVTGYPQVLLNTTASKFYLLARGFTKYDDLKERIQKVLIEATV